MGVCTRVRRLIRSAGVIRAGVIAILSALFVFGLAASAAAAPLPRFGANPQQDDVNGWDWQASSVVTVTVDDPGTLPSPDFETTAACDPQGQFDTGGVGFDIAAGDIVAVTDGTTIKQTTVTTIAVTGVDPALDTVSGTADASSDVWVSVFAPDGPQRLVTTDTSGHWTADFHTAVGPDPSQQAFDIVPGTDGNAYQEDIDGDQTQANWHLFVPVAVGDAFTVAEDATLTVGAPGVLANDVFNPGSSAVEVLFGPWQGTLVLNTVTGAFEYRPHPNWNGTDTFLYRLTDSGVLSNIVVVTINVTPVNDAPVAVDDTATTQQDTTLTVAAPGVLGNDTDVDHDSLVATLSVGPAHGAVNLNTDGSYTYRPAPSWNGTDTFSYRAFDGALYSNTATVTIAVMHVNHAPVAVDDTATTAEDTTLTVAAPGVLGNDTDVDNDSLTATLSVGPAHGAVNLSVDGSYTYRPVLNWNGTDTFSYRAFDGALYSNTATVTITVTPVNDAPVAVDDTATTQQDTTLTVATPGVLGNDTDVDSGSLTATLPVGPAHGALTLAGNGGYTYRPIAGFSGFDTFTYRASDDATLSQPATVTIRVQGLTPIEGSDRYLTNIATTRASFGTGTCDTLIVATGGNYPDALGAAALAGAAKAPVVLVAGDVLRGDIKTEMLRLTSGKPKKTVYILGSTKAVSAKMEASIKSAIGAPSSARIYARLQGADRYGTARAVASAVATLAGPRKTAFIVKGADFPDALLAGPVAFDATMPILLVSTAWDANLGANLRSIGASDCVIIGATSNVNTTIETQLKTLLGSSHVTRPCANADRYAQGVAVANWAASTYHFGWNGVGIATGENFPDALGASVPQGQGRAPLLLTPKLTLNTGVRNALVAHKTEIGTVRFFGGVNAVSQTVRDQVMNAIK